MKYTTKYMKQLFESINFDLFMDKLDLPGFFVMDEKLMEAIWPDYPIDGICIPTEKTYLIGVHEDLTPDQFFNTLVHELIHIYCFEKYNYGGHGKKFKKICQKAVEIYYQEN